MADSPDTDAAARRRTDPGRRRLRWTPAALSGPLLILAAFGLILIGFARAAPPTRAPGPSAARASPVWVVDKAASRLTFRGVSGGQSFDGVFKKWDAEIAFDPENLRTSRALVSVEAASAVTGNPVWDALLPTDDWFAVRRFPTASFSTTAIIAAGPGRYVAQGVLRLKGAARRLSFPFTFSGVKDRAVLTGALTLSRREFGIGAGPSAPPGLADPVTVLVRLSARKAR